MHFGRNTLSRTKEGIGGSVTTNHQAQSSVTYILLEMVTICRCATSHVSFYATYIDESCSFPSSFGKLSVNLKVELKIGKYSQDKKSNVLCIDYLDPLLVR